MTPLEHVPSDLAAGDSDSHGFDWSKYEVRKITSGQDPLFDLVYDKFYEEFNSKGEIEEKSVLLQRLQWDPSQFKSDYSFKYEIIVVTEQGKFVAARDHSIIIRRGHPAYAVIHLSHALIDPAHRGTGMVGWLRAWPLQTARICLSASGLAPSLTAESPSAYLGVPAGAPPANIPITLVAEMEPHLPRNTADTGARFKSYRRAGFQMLNPAQVPYLQPDFRNPATIDREGGPQPIPLRLVLRRMGKEAEHSLSGAEVRATVSALYQMFGSSFRPKDMVPLWEQLRNYYPSDETQVKLVEPGVDPTRGF